MKRQIPLHASSRADTEFHPRPGKRSRPIAEDLEVKRLAIVNVVFYGKPGAPDGEWVLIDAGILGTANIIARAAVARFGPDSRPAAIILTHGHFDHVGALLTLATKWDVPIYANSLEQPFLTGASAYPAPDPSVGGGLMAAISPVYPRGPIDVSRWLEVLPEDEVPGMPGWQWLKTPGHSPGHTSLWRASDRALIAGDAFITTNQESAYSVAVQSPELHGPPQYYTPDWAQARDSVRRLSELRPDLVITGHGPAMRGSEVRSALQLLAHDFDRIAVPKTGRHIRAAA